VRSGRNSLNSLKKDFGNFFGGIGALLDFSCERSERVAAPGWLLLLAFPTDTLFNASLLSIAVNTEAALEHGKSG
jgi:hypothetical protein